MLWSKKESRQSTVGKGEEESTERACGAPQMHTEYESANIRIFRVETSDDRPSRRFSRKP